MKNRSKVMNKLALVLLSIVVLELVLIGDRVQPLKEIKKKIALKKLKKLLPLLALIKPKKKLIIIPIPFPMFKKPDYGHQPEQRPSYHYGSFGNSGQINIADGSAMPTMSYIMFENSESTDFSGLAGGLTSLKNLLPARPTAQPSMGQLAPFSGQSLTTPAATGNVSGGSGFPLDGSSMPTMTMTLQSDAGGGRVSAIKLSMNNQAINSTSVAARQQRTIAPKWHPPQQKPQQQQQNHKHQPLEQFDDSTFDGEPLGGEYYYSTPYNWNESRPLASPAELLRNERLRQQQQAKETQPALFRPHSQPASNQRTLAAMVAPANVNGLSQERRLPMLVVKTYPPNEWRETRPTGNLKQLGTNQPQRLQPQTRQQPQFPHQQQQPLKSPIESEDVVPIGPIQLLPVYQTANGELHMSPPVDQTTSTPQLDTNSSSSFENDDSSPITHSQDEPNLQVEVHTVSPKAMTANNQTYRHHEQSKDRGQGLPPRANQIQPPRETQQAMSKTGETPRLSALNGKLTQQQPIERKPSGFLGSY